MLAQKLTIREIPKLRKSAKNAPYCFSCFRVNYGGNLVLAHDNSLDSGRGASFKSPDYLGAIVCADPGGCHDQIDGRSGGLAKEEKREMHQRAHKLTLKWWFETGIIE